MKVNFKNFNQEALEAREAQQRKIVQRLRAIRRSCRAQKGGR